MKKIVKIIILTLAFILFSALVQGQEIVHDPMSYIVQADQLLNQINTYKAMLTQLELYYKSLEWQVKSLANIDISSYEDFKHYIYYYDNSFESLKNNAHNLMVKIEGEYVALSELIPSSDDMDTVMLELKEAIAQGDQDRIRELHEKLKNLKDLNLDKGKETSKEVEALYAETDRMLKELDERLKSTMADMENPEAANSVTAQLQINNQMMLEMTSLLKQQLMTETLNTKLASEYFNSWSARYYYEEGNLLSSTLTYSEEYEDYQNNLSEKTFDPAF